MGAWAWGPEAARTLLYVGALLAVGRGSVAALDPEWRAGARSVYDAPWPRAVARAGALALVLAPLLLLQGQLAALDMRWAEFPTLLRDTGWGQGWSQLAAACALTTVALMLPVGRMSALGLLLAALGVAAAMGGLGHAAADERWPLGARLLDALHVAAMGAWIGGLAVTLLITRVPTFRLIDAAWRTFSRTATMMAPVTVITGVGSSARILLDVPPAAILASDYGRLLLLKTALVLVVLALGARQRARIGRDAPPEAGVVRLEVGIAGAVLLVTALLTGGEPPSVE